MQIKNASISLLLALAAILSLSGCGDSTQEVGLCTYLGTCPSCDDDDSGCASSDSAPDHSTVDHSNAHDMGGMSDH